MLQYLLCHLPVAWTIWTPFFREQKDFFCHCVQSMGYYHVTFLRDNPVTCTNWPSHLFYSFLPSSMGFSKKCVSVIWSALYESSFIRSYENFHKGCIHMALVHVLLTPLSPSPFSMNILASVSLCFCHWHMKVKLDYFVASFPRSLPLRIFKCIH